NGIEQRVEPFMVGLGEIAQDMAGHALLRAGVTDSDAYAPVLLAAMSVERSDAVVTACAATRFHAHLSGREIQFVVKDGQIGRRELVEAHCLADSLARKVHESLRLDQDDLLAANTPFRNQGIEFLRPRRKGMAAVNCIRRHET